MTTQTDEGNAGEVLSHVVQQVAQQSRTLAMHVTEHDDINAGAQERADTAIRRSQEALEQAHREALDIASKSLGTTGANLLGEFAAAADGIRQETLSSLEQLHQQHQAGVSELNDMAGQYTAEGQQLLERVLEILQQARQQTDEDRTRLQETYQAALDHATVEMQSQQREQGLQYEQALSSASAGLDARLDTALASNVSTYQEALTQATVSLNQAHQLHTDTVVVALDARWSKFSRILVAVTTASSLVAIAAIVIGVL